MLDLNLELCSICKHARPKFVNVTLGKTVFYCETCFPIEDKILSKEEAVNFLRDIAAQRYDEPEKYCLICGDKSIGYILDDESNHFGWCQEHNYILYRWKIKNMGGLGGAVTLA